MESLNKCQKCKSIISNNNSYCKTCAKKRYKLYCTEKYKCNFRDRYEYKQKYPKIENKCIIFYCFRKSLYNSKYCDIHNCLKCNKYKKNITHNSCRDCISTRDSRENTITNDPSCIEHICEKCFNYCKLPNSNYCYMCICNYKKCNEFSMQNLRGCEKHMCQICFKKVKMENIDFCKLCKCVKKGCSGGKIKGKKYCSDHICVNCLERCKLKDFDLCDLCKCNKENCGNFKLKHTKACIDHLCKKCNIYCTTVDSIYCSSCTCNVYRCNNLEYINGICKDCMCPKCPNAKKIGKNACSNHICRKCNKDVVYARGLCIYCSQCKDCPYVIFGKLPIELTIANNKTPNGNKLCKLCYENVCNICNDFKGYMCAPCDSLIDEFTEEFIINLCNICQSKYNYQRVNPIYKVNN